MLLTVFVSVSLRPRDYTAVGVNIRRTAVWRGSVMTSYAVAASKWCLFCGVQVLVDLLIIYRGCFNFSGKAWSNDVPVRMLMR